MATLYEIDQQLLNLVDPETGEITDEEAFSNLMMEKDTKLSNIALWCMNLRSDIEQYENEIDRFNAKIEKAQKMYDRMFSYLDYALQGNAWKDASGRVSCKYTKSETAEIDDESLLAEEFFRTKTIRTVNRAAIRKAFSDGKEVPGAHMEKHMNLKIE